MKETNPVEIKLAARRAVLAFCALLVCVLLAVGLTRIPFGHHSVNVVIALTIAVLQAGLLTGFLMHIVSERKMVFGVLALTGLMFVVLMALIIGAYANHTSKFFS